MPGYKHYYFLARGRGEVCRLALAAANIDFEDIRMNGEQSAKERASMCPDDPFDEATADMISDAAIDLRNGVLKFYFVMDETKKDEMSKEFFTNTLTSARLQKFETLLKGPFFMGDELTYADIIFFDVFNNFLGKGDPAVPGHFSKFPKLLEHYKHMLDVPGIKAWNKKRPKIPNDF